MRQVAAAGTAARTRGVPYPSDDFNIGGTRSVVGGDGIDNSYDVSLYHADVVDMAIFLGHLEEVLNKVHDVGSGVHVSL